jgi:uncharacterized membrane protein YbhN (UPF0104 family)
MPPISRRNLIAALKFLAAAAILVAIGRQFYYDLTDERIHTVTVRPLWLVGSAAVYLVAIGFSGVFWWKLMHLFDQPVRFWLAMKAYYVGHLGKYVPGKAWALLLRGIVVKEPGISMGVAIVTAFYEVLTTMAAGALVAAIVFFVEPPKYRGLDFPPYLTGLFLLVGCGVPLLPGVFNFLARRLARRFASLDVFEMPRLRLPVLLFGIATVSVGWGLMGLSVWMGLASVVEPMPELTLATWAYYCAIIGLAYVAGFAIMVTPGGVGVREFVLRKFLQFAVADPAAAGPVLAANALLLRCAWTLAELVMAALLAILVRRPAPAPVADTNLQVGV